MQWGQLQCTNFCMDGRIGKLAEQFMNWIMFCLQHCVGLTTKIDAYGSFETSVNIIWFVDQDYFRTNIYSTFNSNWTHFLRKYKPAPVPTAARSKVPLLAC